MTATTDTGGYDAVTDTETDDPPKVDLDPPDIKTATFGLPQILLRMWWHRRKRRKLAKSGYVEWYLIDGTFPTPSYIKPSDEGGAMLEYEHGDQTYLFPRQAAIATERQGMWTYIHRKGEADPINLRQSNRHSVDAGALQEYLDMRVSKEPPSWLGNLNITPKHIVGAAIAMIVIYALLQGGVA